MQQKRKLFSDFVLHNKVFLAHNEGVEKLKLDII